MDPPTTAKKIKSMEIRGALEIAFAAANALKEYSKTYMGTDFLCDFEKQGKKACSHTHPARGLQHPLEECTQPHARLGVSNGKGLLKELLQFLAAPTAPQNVRSNSTPRN